jgi:type I restriction enzyme S subunit
MSDDLDFDMEVVGYAELDGGDADGAPSSKERSRSGTEEDRNGEGLEEKELGSLTDEDSGDDSHDTTSAGNTEPIGSENSGYRSLDYGPIDVSVPEEWEVRSLSEKYDLQRGVNYSSDYYREPGQGLPFYTLNSVEKGGGLKKDSTKYYDEEEVDERKTVTAGDILIANTDLTQDGEIVGYPVVIPEEEKRASFSHHLNKLSGGGRVNTQYLSYLLQSDFVHRRMIAFSCGSTVLNLNSDLLKGLDLALPPLPEQRKIASVLYAVDQAIQKTEAIIEQATQAQRGLLRELLTEGFNDHETTNAGALGEIPTDWRTEKLGQVADVQRGKFTHRPRNDPDFYDGAYPFIQTGEVVEARGKLTHYSQTLNEKGRGVSKRFDAGTIVITIAGNIGDTAIATFPIYFPDSLVGITAGDEVDPYYLEFFLRSRKKYLNRLATETTQKNLNLSLLRPIDVALPPLSEQREIAGVLKGLDSKIRSEKRYTHQLQSLKRGLMQDLLTGEVRTMDKAIEVLGEVKVHG